MIFAICRIQYVAICLWCAVIMLVSSPGIARADVPQADSVPQAIKNLDLCTLAYQLYHQSLCLPLDPWYDNMSRVGSDRRTNICRFSQDYAAMLGKSDKPAGQSLDMGYYSGPNAARGWNDSNLNLDPIITNYKHLEAGLPAFTRDGERYMAVHAPAYIGSFVKAIEGVRYKTQPTSFPFNDVERFPISGTPDGVHGFHLVMFEGGTGISGNSQPAWSPMGFVMTEETVKGYDVHIVFRGSRSGSSLGTTVWNAQDKIGNAKGNPDWITDLQSDRQIEQPLISKIGKVTQGFAEALPTMLGPITACCKYLEGKYGAPEHIYVTGHSLGAGLATQFVSAVVQGSYGDQLRNEVKSWPWNNVTLMAYAQPIPGDPDFAANFNRVSPASAHYWVEGDSVVESTSGRLVAMIIDKGEHVGVQNKLNKIADCKDNPHEVFVIRDALLRDLSSQDAEKAKQLAEENTWGYYESFTKMLSGQPVNYVYPGAPAAKIVTDQNVQQMLSNYNFGPEFAGWLENVYAKMIADKSSYVGPKFQSTLDERRKLVLDLVERIRKPTVTESNAQVLDNLAAESKLIDGNLGLTKEEQWIYSGMILSQIQNSKLSLNELLSKPEIKTCLEANID